jgi:glycine/D-amino acid oxidase-like deaminating enzyme
MQVDYLIIGQGISGTMLSWFLYREGKSFMVLDNNQQQAPSKIAAGIINPVTGRRYAYTWMIDEVMPFACMSYEQMGDLLQEKFVMEKSIVDFFPSPQMRNAFIERLSENDTYLHSFPDQNHFNRYFQYDFGCGEVRPAYIVNLQGLLTAWKKKLVELDAVRDRDFDHKLLKLDDDGVLYEEISAGRIIFCDGAAGVQNPFFELLPFAPNKGEALVIESEELTNEHIFKKGLMLAPLAEKNSYWVGSNYQWEFTDDQPSAEFYQHASSVLNGWLKQPYRVLDHRAAVRPATIERRPFVGLHPHCPQVGILNGMGTKGTSLAPFFASQLVQHLVHHLPLAPEASVQRFSRILSR